MTVLWRRPVLVGGVGLTFGLWFLESMAHSLAEVSGLVTLGAIAAGTGLWFLQKPNAQIAPISAPASPVSRLQVEQSLTEVEDRIQRLQAEVATLDKVRPETIARIPTLKAQLQALTPELERQALRVAVVGGQAVGKTSLVHVLQAQGLSLPPSVSWQDLPALLAAETSTLDADTIAEAQTADAVIFVVVGDLTASELQVVQQLATANQRLLLVLNKQDQYLPTERSLVLKQLQTRTQDYLSSADVVVIAAVPSPLKVRQHQADGSVQEWMEQPQPEINLLSERLQQLLTQESQQLVWATTWRSAIALKAEVQAVLNQVRRDRALPLIEQYQWIAAATAFASPVPALDLLAASAINAQLVLDLSAIYQQKFSLQQAQTIAKTMAGLLLKLGLVELSTQAIGTVLKSHAITYVAGGAVQGASAAYLTRLAGLSLSEYFEEQSASIRSEAENPLSLDRLTQVLKTVFQQNQQVSLFQALVKQVTERFTPNPSPQPQPQLQLIAATEPALPLASIPLPNLQLASHELELVEENRSAVSLSSTSLESSSLLST
ncbi:MULTISPECIES: DUF697 domain-containing protein [Trichocoleus]|uniref:DUF697 domain-containing protein n=1 Tax=Trichocoleus desertorum GB2-A4 TaxID=2933944 RepID=A0ABV0J973_9CYAN|nr:DUF697 domain-containing protein [Trichocoleus sp. FACHB-46]MBD1862157.1 DUF697 domain-containing protein [Trichocoleus sp. FACHB-46]